MLSWQLHHKAGAQPFDAFDADIPAVGVGDLLANSQAQTDPTAGPHPRLVHPVETLKNTLKFVGGNALSIVGYRADDKMIPLLGAKDHPPFARRFVLGIRPVLSGEI